MAVCDYDIGFAWNWEYDDGFACLLEKACIRANLSLLQVTPGNLDSILASVYASGCRFRAFLDRASDSDSRFQPLADRARADGILRINPQEMLDLYAADTVPSPPPPKQPIIKRHFRESFRGGRPAFE